MMRKASKLSEHSGRPVTAEQGAETARLNATLKTMHMRKIVGIGLPSQSKSSLKSTSRGFDLVLWDCVWLSPVVGI